MPADHYEPGETTSKPFQLTWKPTPGDMQITATVPAIPADSQPHPLSSLPATPIQRGGTFQPKFPVIRQKWAITGRLCAADSCTSIGPAGFSASANGTVIFPLLG